MDSLLYSICYQQDFINISRKKKPEVDVTYFHISEELNADKKLQDVPVMTYLFSFI